MERARGEKTYPAQRGQTRTRGIDGPNSLLAICCCTFQAKLIFHMISRMFACLYFARTEADRDQPPTTARTSNRLKNATSVTEKFKMASQYFGPVRSFKAQLSSIESAPEPNPDLTKRVVDHVNVRSDPRPERKNK